MNLTTANFSIDHLVPPAHGGSDLLSNLVPACRPCNAAKGQNLSFDSLRQYLIEVALKKSRPVRVTVVPRPIGRKILPDGGEIMVLPSGPLFALKLFFEERSLKP
jgi:hypothetical protein